MHDKARKTLEVRTLAAFLFSRLYLVGNGLIYVRENSYVPYILFSNLL